jgi:hypothetical protein
MRIQENENHARPDAGSMSDLLLIHEVIGFYADGGSQGNPALVAQAFHPSATMKFIRDSALVDVPIADFLKNYIKEGVVQQRTVGIDYVDVEGCAASAKITIDYPTHQFVDYFNLLKTDGRWLIVSKIFHRFDR